MLDTLERKIKQMHAAMGAMSSSDVLAVVPEVVETATYRSIGVDFNKNADPIELANAASLLVANIASLKDHLRAWCKLNSVNFTGDKLINSNMAVALVHDLWNVDKHGVLNSAPRSGITPRLVRLRKTLSISSGTGAGCGASYKIDPLTGKAILQTIGGGSAAIVITGQIVDEFGAVKADFLTTCVEAVEAWEHVIADAGVVIG